MGKIYCTRDGCENLTTDADIEGTVDSWECWEHDEPEEIIIAVSPHSEGGFSYDVYRNQREFEAYNSIDGGIHTGDDIEGALDSAVDMAKEIIKR